MTLVTTHVRAPFFHPDGKPLAGATVGATLTSKEVDNGVVVPSTITTVTDADGVAILDLWPNSRGVSGSQYIVSVRYGASTIWSGFISVPEVEGVVDMSTMLRGPSVPVLSDAQAATLQAQSYAAQSSASAYKAETHGQAAAASVTEAGQQALASAASAASSSTSAAEAIASAAAAASAVSAAEAEVANARSAAADAAGSVSSVAAIASAAKASADLAATLAEQSGNDAASAAASAAVVTEISDNFTATLAQLATNLVTTQTMFAERLAFLN